MKTAELWEHFQEKTVEQYQYIDESCMAVKMS